MSRRIVTRQDGTRRVVEISRSGRVKADWPACDSCEGTGIDTGTRIVERVQRIRGGNSGSPRYRITFTDGSAATTEDGAAFVFELPNDETVRHWPYRITFNARGDITDMKPLRTHGLMAY